MGTSEKKPQGRFLRARREATRPEQVGLPSGRGRRTLRWLAASIASKSPKAVRLAKQALNGIELLEPKQSYRYEQGFTLELYTLPDSQESRDAFVEKRDAKFDK